MRFATIDVFYDLRGGRWSGESDFGVWWHDGRPWPHYRVSVVRDTGDVYAINQSDGVVELLGTVAGDDIYAAAESVLAGWSTVEPIELGWIRERLGV